MRDDRGATPAAARAARSTSLAAGRATQAQQRQRHLDAVVTAAGAASLHELLRERYGSGAGLDQLMKLTGLGRTRLRAELAGAGVAVRPSGVNNPASRQARAARNDATVAARVGTRDIRSWLRTQRRAGVPLRDLAQRTGRSIPWVQARLAGPLVTRLAQ
jgi:hypothetical protein